MPMYVCMYAYVCMYVYICMCIYIYISIYMYVCLLTDSEKKVPAEGSKNLHNKQCQMPIFLSLHLSSKL